MTITQRVLVVDDQPDIVELTCAFLEQLGHTCERAATGLRAIELAAAFDPHVVLLDIGLPDVEGYDVARAIRARSGVSEVYIAAITGWGREEDRERALASGFDRYVVKPANGAALREIMLDAAMRRLGSR